uniref:calsyntenin-2-like n=1 Tax=Gasterosteus aculeatus aculeatus TaxID=481459 RepID=UPI001A97E94C|nr:calsyntenin-2-like [Gasterosteus aculeatus aculeatus]
MLRTAGVLVLAALALSAARTKVNKHKPWIETSYHGVITEDTDVVLLDPPLVALDKDAPVPYAGTLHSTGGGGLLIRIGKRSCRMCL